MGKLTALGSVFRETRAVDVISKAQDGLEPGRCYKCVNKADPTDVVIACRPGTIKKAVDTDVYTCTEI
jgi:hypothetical protein